MLSRRDFLRGASALALTPQVERILEHHLRHEAPLLTPPPKAHRVFYMHRDPDHPGFRIMTDALPFPRRLVKFDVIEEAFGEGSFRKLTQREHWRLIDQGRFSREDTFQPGVGDGYYPVWAANYSPDSEAVGLLEALGLGPEDAGPAGSGLAFENCEEDFGGLPAVYCETPEAVSLLQVALNEKHAGIEVRFEERTFPKVSWEQLLRTGGNLAGL